MFGWINKIKNRIALKKTKKHHDKVVSDYYHFARSFGDALSYAYLGEPQVRDSSGKWLSYQGCLDRLDELEEDYATLGYRILSLDDWIDHGGYARNIDHLLLAKRLPDERPVFTRDLIRLAKEKDES